MFLPQVIGLIGDRIKQMSSWNDMDSAVFILTGVAPRAPAGQDQVIPNLIKEIPSWPYPKSGIPGLLLRIAAGRLILYTAGYLAINPEALVPTMKFLLMDLLPSLPNIDCADKDLRQYSQAICTDALRITTQSAKEKILELNEGKFWKEVITQITNLVLNPGFHSDVRTQMAFSVGHIIGAMKDYDLMLETLKDFVKRLEPNYDVEQAEGNSKEGKGPPELKCYLAAISCCYDVKIDPVAHPNVTSHPVLKFWEEQWPVIEKLTVLAVRKDWEDWLEQFCVSLSFIFTSAKPFALNSPLLIKGLTLLSNAAEHKPFVHYYRIVRALMSLFAPEGIVEVDNALVGFLGSFATPVARKSKAGECLPEIMAAAFEMLSDALRWSNLANGALQSTWLSEVFECGISVLQAGDEICTHEAALTAILRFYCSFLRWACEGPEVVKYAKPLWEGENRMQRLIDAILNLLARCAENPRASTVGALAEVLRPMLMGPMEFEAKTHLKKGLQKLPPPLNQTQMDSQKIVETMSIGKIDQRRFNRILYDLVEGFYNALRKTR